MVQARLTEVGKERAEIERHAASLPASRDSGKDEAATLHQLRAEVGPNLEPMLLPICLPKTSPQTENAVRNGFKKLMKAFVVPFSLPVTLQISPCPMLGGDNSRMRCLYL